MEFEGLPHWQKSSASGIAGCVEAAHETRILVRDSKNPDGPVLAYTAQEWAAFLEGVKNGEFDYLLEIASAGRVHTTIGHGPDEG